MAFSPAQESGDGAAGPESPRLWHPRSVPDHMAPSSQHAVHQGPSQSLCITEGRVTSPEPRREERPRASFWQLPPVGPFFFPGSSLGALRVSTGPSVCFPRNFYNLPFWTQSLGSLGVQTGNCNKLFHNWCCLQGSECSPRVKTGWQRGCEVPFVTFFSALKNWVTKDPHRGPALQDGWLRVSSELWHLVDCRENKTTHSHSGLYQRTFSIPERKSTNLELTSCSQHKETSILPIQRPNKQCSEESQYCGVQIRRVYFSSINCLQLHYVKFPF